MKKTTEQKKIERLEKKKVEVCFGCKVKNRSKYFVQIGVEKIYLCPTCYFGLLGAMHIDFKAVLINNEPPF